MTITRESLLNSFWDALLYDDYVALEKIIAAMEELSYKRGLKDAYEQLDCVWSEPVVQPPVQHPCE